MPRNYVDNAMNRSLGRVGMPLGSAVHSRGSGGGGGGSSFGFSSGASSSLFSSMSSSPKTYVDNAQNRSLGRVGLEHGTAVHSRSGASSSSYSSGSSSPRTYVDNAQNRSLGRVGLEHGTAVHSRSGASSSSYSSGSSSPKTYVENAQNRSLGRVGLEHGTAVHSRSQTKVYKDNPLNRRLGRAGKPFGTMPHPKKEAESYDKTVPTKVYVDNAFNRKHNRVGKPLGSAPISRKNEVYRDTPFNHSLGRVGKPWSSLSKNRQSQILRILREHPAEDPTDFFDFHVPEEDIIEDAEHVLDLMNREEAVNSYLESRAKGSEWQDLERTSSKMIEKYRGLKIKFEELEMGNKIGHGGFGEVYFATWRNEVVAVKKLRCQTVTKKRLRQFEDETLLYCTLDHPNVVQFIGACLERPNLAIVMEYMDKSLYEVIHMEQVDLTTQEKRTVIQGLVKGVEYLHSKAIAHCDLKSQNVLVNNVRCEKHYNPKEDVLAKITDFGLSKMKSDMETSTSTTGGKTVFGTPKYMAPEVLRGECLDTDELFPTDVYSMGLLIYELIMEEVPFEDLDMNQLRKQVGMKGLKPTMSSNILLDNDVEDLLNKCWEYDPDKRPTAKQAAMAALGFTSLLVEEEE